MVGVYAPPCPMAAFQRALRCGLLRGLLTRALTLAHNGAIDAHAIGEHRRVRRAFHRNQFVFRQAARFLQRFLQLALRVARRGGRFHSKPFGKNAAGCHPYFTQSGKDREGDGDQHIANFCNGATAGFKYFAISGLGRVGVTVCGEAQGTMQVRNALDGETVAEIAIRPTGGKAETFFGDYKGAEGTQALYFTFVGSGSIRKFIDIVLE